MESYLHLKKDKMNFNKNYKNIKKEKTNVMNEDNAGNFGRKQKLFIENLLILIIQNGNILLKQRTQRMKSLKIYLLHFLRIIHSFKLFQLIWMNDQSA